MYENHEAVEAQESETRAHGSHRVGNFFPAYIVLLEKKTERNGPNDTPLSTTQRQRLAGAKIKHTRH
jgi:hypothetical protein